jgi:hypothetical protein
VEVPFSTSALDGEWYAIVVVVVVVVADDSDRSGGKKRKKGKGKEQRPGER